jgi:ABC-type branched-subunit amino acid transport system substrate-binding protein
MFLFLFYFFFIFYFFTDQARSILTLIKHFNITNFAVLLSNDEAGNGFNQEMQTFAPNYNLTLAAAIFADSNKEDYEPELSTLLRYNVQTVVMMVTGHDAVVML